MINPLTYRLTREEHGTRFSRGSASPYTEIYTQPWWRYLAAEAYHHAWERSTWHIWRYLERFDPRDDTPFSNRQEIRCFDLHRKGRVVVSVTIG